MRILEMLVDLLFYFTVFLLVGILLAFYSPITYFKDLWITTAMTTYSHRWLATAFFTEEEIYEVMARNNIQKPLEKIKLDEIVIEAKPGNAENANKVYISINLDEEKWVPKETKSPPNPLIEEIDLAGKTYKGKALIVHDPSRVFVGIAENLGKEGDRLPKFMKRYGASYGINGGGFSDKNGKGNGGIANGIVISEGKIIQGKPGMMYNIIGFNKDDKLVIGAFSYEEILEQGIRDAVFFKPILVLNGKPVQMVGNGGWGIAPRTAIGQRKDGAVILVVIDGRRPGHSIGATMVELRDIMVKLGAYNACNLDGGASTIMMKGDKVLNRPSSNPEGRRIPTAFLVS